MQQKTLNTILLTTLKGVGEVLNNRLAKLGLFSVQDLLFHFPLRYEDRSHVYPINQLHPALFATIKGTIVHTVVENKRRKMLLCQVRDETGIITLRFMHFNQGMQQSLKVGVVIQAYGEVKQGVNGYQMLHPQYKLNPPPLHTHKNPVMTAIYPTTDGVSQAMLMQLTDQALSLLNHRPLPELLPHVLLSQTMTINEAIHFIHRPTVQQYNTTLESKTHPAQQRLIIEELLAHHLSMLHAKQQTTHYHSSALIAGPLVSQFIKQLPFPLTAAQQNVINDIRIDLGRTQPMMRLVQGDVGSGKTVVAAICALIALENQQQVVMMAPTELLAEQHATNFRHWFKPLSLHVGWLAGKQKGKARQHAMQDIATGKTQMIIGTHAVFQEEVAFKQLALVIIDEQHRFGVMQRLTLWEKGQSSGHVPHQLVMTATPIPRTLAMTFYADLDTSIIDELPPGRTPITTVAIPHTRRLEVIERVKQACHNDRQVYWVCTLIEESEVLEAQAAENTVEELRQQLPELSIGLVHGRMKADEKQKIMHDFKEGTIQLLVATTVIEVGVDVPNASLMIIDNPERLGLAQLHQLRGRVGRGAIASHCVLLYQTPLNQTAKKRLNVLRDSNDGFYIAEQDLQIRGAGELLGTRQTGSIQFRIADLKRDQSLIPQVQQLAKMLNSSSTFHAKQLIDRWLPEKKKYINA